MGSYGSRDLRGYYALIAIEVRAICADSVYIKNTYEEGPLERRGLLACRVFRQEGSRPNADFGLAIVNRVRRRVDHHEVD